MGLRGSIIIPGDKSLSHRALMFSSLCRKPSRVTGLLHSKDVEATQNCLAQLGVVFKAENEALIIRPPEQWHEPTDLLNVDNSGTSIRLLSGLLAAQPFFSVITGDVAIRRRPMQRVIDPLIQMGGRLSGRNNNRLAPIAIQPCLGALHGLHYQSPVASAQVKSAILLAGLFADSQVYFKEPALSRDHTERLYQALGIELTIFPEDHSLQLAPGQIERFWKAPGWDWTIPGDMSSAAFLMVAATVIPNSELLIKNVGLNPARTGLMSVLQSAGASIQAENTRQVMGEPVADLLVRSAALSGDIYLEEADIPALVDEIPILMVAGLYLNGTLKVRGAEELRAKESDRLAAMQQAFEALSIPLTILPDGFDLMGQPDRQITEPTQILDVFHDHRIAMSLAILNTIASPHTVWPMNGREWVNISFPGFYETLQSL